MASISYDSDEFFELLEQTTANLKKLAEMQNNMHWQFGDQEVIAEFDQAVTDTKEGWLASNC